jgi:hypothetical protein
VWSHG